MTPKCTLVALIFVFSWIEDTLSASFSNVVVQRGPVEYVNYDPSSVSFSTSQLAQLSAAPLEQVLSIPAASSVVSPCVAPCVIPNNPIPALTSLPSTASARIVEYRPSLPNLPVILTSNDEARGYQYAYAVFDDQTGDKKTQSEHSDGSVVQGQYSFIQPDGIRRVVVYTADDLNGFNAVVRNISPEHEHPKEGTPEANNESKQALLPCTEVKNEHLTHAGHEDSSEENHTEIEHMDDKKSEEKDVENVSEKAEDQSNEGTQPASKPTGTNTNIPNAIISYNDIINCLQTKLQGAKSVVSPLTYVLIPTSRSPC